VAQAGQPYVLKTGDTMSGDLTIAKATPILFLNKSAAGDTGLIYGMEAGVRRWAVELGNTASDFTVSAFNNAGTYTNTPITINRTSGAVSLAATTPSSSSTTGALVVTGGVGIGGALHSLTGPIRIATEIHLGGTLQKFGLAFDGTTHWGLAVAQISGTVGGSYVAFVNSANSAIGSIQQATGTSVVYNTVSDGRHKPNRERLALDYARGIIDALEVYNFDKDGNAIRGIGLVAQQAHSIHKSLATPGRTDEDWWMAEKAAPMPFVIANVQQLNQRLDALERQLKEQH
jgi:hypothetical protein